MMLYISGIVFFLLNSVCTGNTSRRENKDLSHIFEKQQGFSNMGRHRQGKNMQDVTDRNRYLRDGNTSGTLFNTMKKILRDPHAFLNHLFENEGYNDNERLEKNDTQDENILDWVTKKPPKKKHEPKKKNEPKKKGNKNDKNSTLEHDVAKIGFELTKLWCATRIEGDTITKITECLSDEESVQKVKYCAKVLLNNNPKTNDIDFLHCISRIKIFRGVENEPENKKQMNDCFKVHGITEERLSHFLSELINERQNKDLKGFYQCLTEEADEEAKQHLQDCIDVDPILFEVIDRIKMSFLQNRTLTMPSALKSAKSFSSNLKDLNSNEADDNQEDLKFNFNGDFEFQGNDS